MLGGLQHYLAAHRQALQQSLARMLQQPLSSLATLLVLAITLTLPTLFWTASDNLRTLSAQWNIKGQLTVYYLTDLPENAINALHSKIHNLEAVGDTRFISAQEALENLRQEEGMQDALRDLPDNPLPAATVVIPRIGGDDAQAVMALQTAIQSMPGVDLVKIDRQWIQRIKAIFALTRQISNLIIVLLAAAVILIIANTLRLMMQNQQDEIRILKLIGAPDRFILRPFLYAGIVYGLFAAGIAIILSNICLSLISVSLHQLAAQYDMPWELGHLNLRETCLILLFATLLGWLGARLAVKKQLRTIEPDM